MKYLCYVADILELLLEHKLVVHLARVLAHCLFNKLDMVEYSEKFVLLLRRLDVVLN